MCEDETKVLSLFLEKLYSCGRGKREKRKQKFGTKDLRLTKECHIGNI